MSRSRAAMKTWGASLFYTFTTMVTSFVVTPAIFEILGEERFGLARSLTELFAFLSIVAVGITISLVPRLAAANGRGDRMALDRNFVVGMRMYTAAAGMVVLVGLCLTPFIGTLLKVGPALMPQVRIAWILSLAAIPLSILGLMKVLMELAHKGYLVYLFLAAQGMLSAVLTIVWVRAGYGIVGVVGAVVAGSILYHFAATYIAIRTYPGLLRSIFTSRPLREDWIGVLVILGPTVIAILSERIGVLSDSVLLAGLLGGAAAGRLNVNQRLSSLGQTMLNAISSAVWPSLAEMFAKNEIAGFNIRLIELTRLVGLVGVSGFAPVIAFNHHFLRLWIGPGHYGGRTIVLLASFNAILLTLLQIYNASLVTTGKVARLVKPAAISAALNVTASVFFTKWLGLIGPLVGTAVATLAVQAWFIPTLLKRIFGTSLRQLLVAIAIPCLWGVPFTVSLCFLSDYQATPGWARLLSEMALSAGSFLVFGIFVILGPHDRQLWNARLVAPLLGRFRRKSRVVTVSAEYSDNEELSRTD